MGKAYKMLLINPHTCQRRAKDRVQGHHITRSPSTAGRPAARVTDGSLPERFTTLSDLVSEMEHRKAGSASLALKH